MRIRRQRYSGKIIEGDVFGKKLHGGRYKDD